MIIETEGATNALIVIKSDDQYAISNCSQKKNYAKGSTAFRFHIDFEDPNTEIIFTGTLLECHAYIDLIEKKAIVI